MVHNEVQKVAQMGLGIHEMDDMVRKWDGMKVGVHDMACGCMVEDYKMAHNMGCMMVEKAHGMIYRVGVVSD